MKLQVIGSSTVQCYNFWNYKSGVVKRFRGRYMALTVTAELQTANVAYFQRKIQLSGFSEYPDGLPSQLIQMSGLLLYLYNMHHNFLWFGHMTKPKCSFESPLFLLTHRTRLCKCSNGKCILQQNSRRLDRERECMRAWVCVCVLGPQ